MCYHHKTRKSLVRVDYKQKLVSILGQSEAIKRHAAVYYDDDKALAAAKAFMLSKEEVKAEPWGDPIVNPEEREALTWEYLYREHEKTLVA